ncbi:MAG: hypothetical protein GIW99_04005 [Candidatus Eremiobacteraeota bacterium]|nr:hypothetical protein [Candidatus Eremiobacteraeota bacterium]
MGPHGLEPLSKITHMVAKCIIVTALLFEVAASSACAKSAGRPSEGLLPSPPAIPASTIQSITLDRGGCYGSCPVYRVTFERDGSATYKGVAFVDKIGLFSGRADFNLIAAWLETQNLHRYAGAYGMNWIDADTLTLTVVRDANQKTVVQSKNSSYLPLEVRGIVAALNGFADNVAWRRASSLDAYMGSFVDDRNAARLVLVDTYPTAMRNVARGSLLVLTPSVCAPGGIKRSIDEAIELRLAGSRVTAFSVNPNTKSPLPFAIAGRHVVVRVGADSYLLRRVSFADRETLSSAFIQRYRENQDPYWKQYCSGHAYPPKSTSL